MTSVKQLFLNSGKQLCMALFFTCGLCLTASTLAKASPSLQPPSDTRDLVARLTDSDRTTRTAAAFELRLYGQSAMPFLFTACDDMDPTQRRGGVVGLTLLPTPALGIDKLLSALDDTDMGTRSLAAQGLALIGIPAAKKLADKLSNPNTQSRDAAAFGLKMLGKKAVPALIEILRTDNNYARSKAAWLLGRIGPDAQSAIPALVNALDVKDERAMHVIAEAIDLIAPPSALTAFHLIQINSVPGCPVQRIGAKAAPTLVRLLTRPGTPLAQTAFRTLATIGDQAKPALKQAISSGTQGQRIASALLLVEIDPDEVFTLPEDVRNALANVPRKPKQ